MEPVGLEAGNCGYGKTENFRDCFCVLSEINPPLRARGWKGALEIREVKSEGLDHGESEHEMNGRMRWGCPPAWGLSSWI